MDDQETASGLLAALRGDGSDDGSRSVERLDAFCDGLEGALVDNHGGGRRRKGNNDGSKERTAAASAAVGRCAVELHASLLAAACPSLSSQCDESAVGNLEEDCAAACELSERIAGELFDDGGAAAEGVDRTMLAALLRTAGLFLRWTALSEDGCSSSAASVGRLCCRGMLRLYAGLLRESPPASEGPEDVGRFASICIFRSTYGDAPRNATARIVFVEELDGCRHLVRALARGGQPAARLFSVARNVHHLVAACPREAVPRMEEAAAEIISEEQSQNEGEEEKECPTNLTGVLVGTLSWAVSSEPPFPGGPEDRRGDLALELLRALYALNVSGLAAEPSRETSAEIGAALRDVLGLSSADGRAYRCKLAAVNLLLDAPKGHSRYLVESGAVTHLVDVLSYQTSLVVVERTASTADDAAAVLPVLLALLRIVKSEKEALEIVRRGVFPLKSESAFRELADAEVLKGNGEGTVRAKNMAPLDAPRGTLRWRLVRLMTWLESGVKRAACELLYALCGEDGTELVLRTGFGNAVHFLGVRGAVSLPRGVDV